MSVVWGRTSGPSGSARWSRTSLVALATGLTLLGFAAPAHATTSAHATAGTIYVTNLDRNTVTAIDPVTHAAHVISGFKGPLGIAITPNGHTALVTNSLGNSVTPVALSGETGTPGAPIKVGGNPAAVAISAAGTMAYVTNFNSNSVTPIDLATSPPHPGTPIKVGAGPWSLALSPDGALLVVANSEGNSVSVVTLASGAVTNVALGSRPQAVAVAPDGATAYVAVATGVVPIGLRAGHVAAGALISIPGGPVGLAILPDGHTAFTANNDNTLSAIDLTVSPPSAGAAVTVGTISQPDGIAISPSGLTAYVANATNTVTPIDLKAQPPRPLAAIGVGAATFGIAVGPDQAPVAHLTVIPGRAGQPTTFDATASTSVDGGITKYAWSFGDGTTAVTKTPTTTHIYRAGGHYVVSVTETSKLGTSTATSYTGQTMSNHGSKKAATSTSVKIFGALQTIPASGPPGIRVDLRDTSLSSSCSPVYIFFDGRLVSEVPATGHAMDDRNLVIPGNATLGRHQLEIGCSETGARMVATQFTVVPTTNHLSEFSVAMPTFTQLRKNLVGAGGVSLGMLLISRLIAAGFPSQWLDSTYEANRHRLQARMRKRFPNLFKKRDVVQSLVRRTTKATGIFIAFILTAGAINALLDPGFGWNRTTLWLFLGQALGVGIVTLASQVPVAIGGLRQKRDVHLQVLIGGLLIAIVCVAISRAIGLSPGYCYGLIAIFVLRPKVEAGEWGKLHAIASLVVFVVSAGAFLLTIPVFHAATAAHPSPFLLILVPALNVAFLGGFASLAFGMFPLPFLPGYHVKDWNRGAWMLISFVGLIGFLSVLLAPGAGSSNEIHHVAIVPLIVAFVIFAVGSLIAIIYFHRHPSAEPDEEGHHHAHGHPSPHPDEATLDPAPGADPDAAPGPDPIV